MREQPARQQPTERIVFKTVERTLELACGAAHPLLGALRRLAAQDKPSALRLLRDILHARSFVSIREAYAHSPALRKPGSDGQTGSSYELNDWHEALCRVLSPCDDTEEVREKLADAIWQIQQNQLARATLIPLLLQQVYDTAPTAASLQVGPLGAKLVGRTSGVTHAQPTSLRTAIHGCRRHYNSQKCTSGSPKTTVTHRSIAGTFDSPAGPVGLQVPFLVLAAHQSNPMCPHGSHQRVVANTVRATTSWRHAQDYCA